MTVAFGCYLSGITPRLKSCSMRSCTFSITVPLQFRASHAAKFLSNRTTSGMFTLQAYHQRILKFGKVTAGGRLGSLCSRRWASIVHKMVPPAHHGL